MTTQACPIIPYSSVHTIIWQTITRTGRTVTASELLTEVVCICEPLVTDVAETDVLLVVCMCTKIIIF